MSSTEHPDLPESGSPADWLRYARSDLALARMTPSAEILTEALCFHAQQAVEKAVKAVLVAYKITFPYTHNIRRLLEMLPDDLEVTETIWEAAELTEYAVLSRYPADLGYIDEVEHRRAVSLAESVMQWAVACVENR